MKKNSINIEIDFNFKVIGIVAPIHDFRMCFNINKTLNIDLVVEANSKNIAYNTYHYRDDISRTDYNLINNRNGSEFLIPEKKELDFFLLIKGHIEINQIEQILEKIKNIQEVQIAFEIEVNQLRSKENLIML